MIGKRFRLPVFFLLIASTMVVSGESQQYEINADTIIESDWEIPAGSTVIIKPGVHIEFQGYRTLVIRGVLLAKGTALEKIVFSSASPLSNQEASLSWKGFLIMGKKADAQFRNCRFSGAYKNLVWEAQPSFDSCEFTNNYYGLYCTRMSAPFVKNSTFHNNTFGITIDYATPQLSTNQIFNNKTGLYLQSAASVTSENNEIYHNGKDISAEDFSDKNATTPTSIHRIWDILYQLF